MGQAVIILVVSADSSSWSHDLRCEVTSIDLSSDGRRVVISCNPDVSTGTLSVSFALCRSGLTRDQELRTYAIEPHLQYLRKFTGHVQTRFLVRSGWGAHRDRFIVSGSEGELYE